MKEIAQSALATALFFVSFLLFLRSFDKPAYGEVDCLTCHRSLVKKKVVHAAVQMGCPACHSGIDASKFPHIKTNKMPKGLSSEVPELCYGCHDKAIFTKKNVHPALAMGCTSCHNPHSADAPKLLLAEPPDLCYKCHDKKQFEGKDIHPPVAGGMCISCHNPHSLDTAKLLVSEPPALCYNCHDQNKFKGNSIHPPVEAGMCLSCHSPHKSDNQKLLRSTVPDLCFTCHDKAGFTKKDVHPPVAGGMCLSCHNPHESSHKTLLVNDTINVCALCHDRKDILNGTHVVRGFRALGHPVKGEKDPKRPDHEFSCSSCHNPHSSDSVRLFRYSSQSTFDLCQQCHQK